MTRPGAAAALALLVALAACTGGGDRGGQGTAGGGQPVSAGGPTRPDAVWSSGPQSRARPGGGDAVLSEVRAARQPGYDRLVFEFEGGLPGYQARYVGQVTTAGGERLDLQGGAVLLLSFDGASGGDAGATSQDLRPGFGSLKQVGLVDQGGGRLRFAVGVEAVAGYLAHDLTSPDRVIIDVAA